jgi:hypothetical protein
VLDVAHTTPFVGTAATDFLEFLHRTDEDIQGDKFVAYAKTISVLQSSGMGKSRMLTEVRPFSIDSYHLTKSLLGW